jgi:hypothetical protein
LAFGTIELGNVSVPHAMKERDIFLAALEIADRDGREAFPNEVCSEPGLKEHILALLEAQAKLGTFLDPSAQPAERAGTGVGPAPSAVDDAPAPSGGDRQ